MLDHLRQVIGWRGYAQRDPLNEYKSEAFELFNALINQWHELATAQLMRVEVAFEQQPPEPAAIEASSMGGETSLDEINALIAAGALSPQSLGLAEERVEAQTRDPQDPASWGKVGRNEACPCGSGKKFKHCHGVFA